MIGWLCWSGLSEGAQVGTGSPPWYLLSDRWSVRSNVILIISCRHIAVFLQCSSLLKVADPTDRGLPTSAAHLADMSLMADILLIISRPSASLLLF
jgi:hypothetical protein